MDFLEKDLEDIIFNTDNVELEKRGLTIDGKKIRQLRIGNYGISDIITVDRIDDHHFEFNDERILRITVFELKQNDINAQTMMQAYRYCKGIERYINGFRNKGIDIAFKVVLIGKKIGAGEFIYLADFIDSMEVYTYEYRFDGIFFKPHKNYVLIEEGFHGKNSNKLPF